MDQFEPTIETGRNGHAGEYSAPTGNDQPLIECFAELIDTTTGPIGRVVGSEREPAGAHQFCIWASDSALSLDIGHIVVAFSEEAAVIGVVDEPRRFSDLRTFLDDYFDRHVEEALLAGEPPTLRPEILVFTINVLATKHRRDDVTSNRPPVSGPVFYATREAIDYALGRPDFSGIPIPALMHTNGNAERDASGNERLDERGNVVFQRAPIWLDEDYLLGPEAGHANWTGQSGLATKTSHALFLTSAVFQGMRAHGKSVAALMFNVKGPDLLWLDKPANPEGGFADAYEAVKFKGLSEKDKEAYRALELAPEPFEHVRIFAPFKPSQVPRVADGTAGATIFLERERKSAVLNTLRTAPAETDCVYPILWELRPLLSQAHKVFDRNDLDDKLWGLIAEIRERRNIKSLHELAAFFQETDDYFADNPEKSEWQGHHKFTIMKAKNRFNALPSKFNGLLTDGRVNYGSLPRVEDPFQDQEVRVVDIAHCNTNVQELIVGSVIHEVWRLAEQSLLGVDKVIVFVDELNKYAPGGGEGGLRGTLVDIAARGRHLNVVLFGAQQFRSKVDDEVLGNCGTSFYGRVGDEELTNSAYRSLSETAKAELLGLPKGRLLARHAHFRAPVFGAFPLPPTVPGMMGQRIFNDAVGRARADVHPGETVYKLVKRLMKDDAPHKHEVLNGTDGFAEHVLVEICTKIEMDWQRVQGSTSARRITPWVMVQQALKSQRRVISR